jgi:hypothetical protein
MGHVRNDVARGLGKHKVPGKARSHDLCLRDMFAGSPGSDSYLVTTVIDEIDGHVLVPHALESVVAVMAIQDNHGPLVHDDGVLDHAVPHQIALDSHQVLVQNLLVLSQGVYGYQCYCHSFSFFVSSPVTKEASRLREASHVQCMNIRLTTPLGMLCFTDAGVHRNSCHTVIVSRQDSASTSAIVTVS